MDETTKKSPKSESAYTRIEACIRILQMLSDGQVHKKSDLAAALGYKDRNIAYCINVLENMGYYVDRISGAAGGYKLIGGEKMLPVLNLTKEEQSALIKGQKLLDHVSFPESNVYKMAFGKIFARANRTPDDDDTLIIPGVTLAMPESEIAERYVVVERCIKEKTVLEIDFLSKDNVVQRRAIHPYFTFNYHGAWFVFGYCEMARGMRYFKLNRIQSFTVLQRNFKKLPEKYSSEKNFMSSSGFIKGTDWLVGDSASSSIERVHVKLRLTGKPAMYVKQYLYGKNQVVTPEGVESTLLECDMDYRYNTLHFVLGFGSDCTVLEPEWLKEKVKEEAEKMLKKILKNARN